MNTKLTRASTPRRTGLLLALLSATAAALALLSWAVPDTQRSQKRTREGIEVPIDPARYDRTRVNDGFDTDTRDDYTLVEPFDNEALPEVAVNDGRLEATGPDRFFGLFDSGVRPGAAGSFVAVDPAEFIADAGGEDSLFIGYVKDSNNYVGAWYNNRGASSGLDVRVNGQFQNVPNCCTELQMVSGGRFAVQLDGDKLRSWAQSGRGSGWREVRYLDDVPGIDMADPAVREQYHFMFGIRGDGTDAPQEPDTEIAVDRFVGRSIPTDKAGPRVTEKTPKPGSTVRDRTPRIGATVRDNFSGLTKEDIRLFVDDRRVTSFAYFAREDRLRYVPNRVMKGGGHKVRIVATDAAGNEGASTWRFRVKAR